MSIENTFVSFFLLSHCYQVNTSSLYWRSFALYKKPQNQISFHIIHYPIKTVKPKTNLPLHYSFFNFFSFRGFKRVKYWSSFVWLSEQAVSQSICTFPRFESHFLFCFQIRFSFMCNNFYSHEVMLKHIVRRERKKE